MSGICFCCCAGVQHRFRQDAQDGVHYHGDDPGAVRAPTRQKGETPHYTTPHNTNPTHISHHTTRETKPKAKKKQKKTPNNQPTRVACCVLRIFFFLAGGRHWENQFEEEGALVAGCERHSLATQEGSQEGAGCCFRVPGLMLHYRRETGLGCLSDVSFRVCSKGNRRTQDALFIRVVTEHG